MSFREKKRKFQLYLGDSNPYFEKSVNGYDEYPIEFEKFIDESTLYDLLDEKRVPLKKGSNGDYYHISLIISFGLAHLQRYMRTGHQNSYDIVSNIIFFLIENAYETESKALLLGGYSTTTKEFEGLPSGMNNGMAISLMVRFYKINNERRLLQFCKKLVNAYSITEEEGGFSVLIKEGGLWFEEYPLSGIKVLNGEMFSLLGLIDFQKITGENNADKLVSSGVIGLLLTLPQFDKGWWSNYYVGKTQYIASMKYHSLHILQLAVLYELLEEDILLYYMDKFMFYDNKKNRLKSGFLLLFSKVLQLNR